MNSGKDRLRQSDVALDVLVALCSSLTLFCREIEFEFCALAWMTITANRVYAKTSAAITSTYPQQPYLLANTIAWASLTKYPFSWCHGSAGRSSPVDPHMDVGRRHYACPFTQGGSPCFANLPCTLS